MNKTINPTIPHLQTYKRRKIFLKANTFRKKPVGAPEEMLWQNVCPPGACVTHIHPSMSRNHTGFNYRKPNYYFNREMLSILLPFELIQQSRTYFWQPTQLVLETLMGIEISAGI